MVDAVCHRNYWGGCAQCGCGDTDSHCGHRIESFDDFLRRQFDDHIVQHALEYRAQPPRYRMFILVYVRIGPASARWRTEHRVAIADGGRFDLATPCTP